MHYLKDKWCPPLQIYEEQAPASNQQLNMFR